MQPHTLFHRFVQRMRRNRAAAHFAQHDFLITLAAERMSERLNETTRKFPTLAVVGAHTGNIAPMLRERGDIQTLLLCDDAEKMLQQTSGLRIVMDEEWLPFAENSLDAIISLMHLHRVNDVPGTLAQMKRALKPDGLLLAIFPGGDTLHELRASAAAACATLKGGISPHVSPFLDVREAGGLLQRVGFALPVIDAETLTITYESPMKLLRELQGMGETNSLTEQHKAIPPRRFFPELCAHYAQQFSVEAVEERDSSRAEPSAVSEANSLLRRSECVREVAPLGAERAAKDRSRGIINNRVYATVELITLTAWKPHATQPQPAKRGSGKVSLKEVL